MYLDPLLLPIAALYVLTVPANWLAASLFCAAYHEIGHIIAVRLLGGKILSVHIRFGGAKIISFVPSSIGEIISILAGPAASLSLLLVGRIWPEAAVCGFLQGIFNLLPVYPLDGGRILKTLPDAFPKRSQ